MTVQATESFKELTAEQPELALGFVRDTSIRLGCPSAAYEVDEGIACSGSPDERPSSSGAAHC